MNDQEISRAQNQMEDEDVLADEQDKPVGGLNGTQVSGAPNLL